MSITDTSSEVTDKTVSQQVRDHLPTAVVNTYDKIPTVQEVKDSVYNLFDSFAPASSDEDEEKQKKVADEEDEKQQQTTYLFHGVNMEDFVDWYHKNVTDEKDEKSRYEKIKTWFSEQKDSADKQLNKASESATDSIDAFKKNITDLFDKHSEDKSLLQKAHLDWDSLHAWYNKNVLVEVPEKTRYEKVKSWFSEQKGKATDQLEKASESATDSIDAFKKNITDLFDKHSEDKSLLQKANLDWDSFHAWYDKNALAELPEKTRYEKVKNWFSEQKDSADKQLNKASASATNNADTFKKDITDLFDKHSEQEEEKTYLESLGDKWTDLKNWYHESVVGQEPEKTRYQKVKEWLGLNTKKDNKQ